LSGILKLFVLIKKMKVSFLFVFYVLLRSKLIVKSVFFVEFIKILLRFRVHYIMDSSRKKTSFHADEVFNTEVKI
jgi:hypothetical protein